MSHHFGFEYLRIIFSDFDTWNVISIDDEVIDMQYHPLCSPKLKNSFLTRDHDKLTILASCLHLLSFLAPNPPKKWQVIYGWPCFEIIMACYSLLFPTIPYYLFTAPPDAWKSIVRRFGLKGQYTPNFLSINNINWCLVFCHMILALFYCRFIDFKTQTNDRSASNTPW